MALHAAARSGDVDEARRIIAAGQEDINARDQLNRTPLHLAAWAGHTDMVQLLLEHHAAVGATAADDTAALHFAAQKGHENIVRLLLAAGAKAAAHTRKGFSPLHFAAMAGNVSVTRLLARRAPEVMLQKNGKGKTPLDLAKGEEMKNMLLQEMKEGKKKAKNNCPPIAGATAVVNIERGDGEDEYGEEEGGEEKSSGEAGQKRKRGVEESRGPERGEVKGGDVEAKAEAEVEAGGRGGRGVVGGGAGRQSDSEPACDTEPCVNDETRMEDRVEEVEEGQAEGKVPEIGPTARPVAAAAAVTDGKENPADGVNGYSTGVR